MHALVKPSYYARDEIIATATAIQQRCPMSDNELAYLCIAFSLIDGQYTIFRDTVTKGVTYHDLLDAERILAADNAALVVEKIPSSGRSYIGCGGMADVYSLAYHGKACAVKVYNKLEGVIEYITKEITALAKLRDVPHVIQLVAINITKREICLEHGGDDITLHLSRRNELPADYRLQLVKGLAAIHRAGMIHTDLRCSNILIEDGYLTIADFGTAVIGTSTYAANMMLTAAYYRAPELSNSCLVTQAIDVWSCGIVFLVGDRHLCEKGIFDEEFSDHIEYILTQASKDSHAQLCLKRSPDDRITAEGLLNVLSPLPTSSHQEGSGMC